MESEEGIRGGLLGTAVGDAVGQLAFKYKDEEELMKEVEKRETIGYTDDTAMVLGIVESLVEKEGELDHRHLGDTFRENYLEEPWRGYGQGPLKIFEMVGNGEKEGYVEAAETSFGGEGSKGNGSAMRVAPVSLFYSGEKEEVKEKAKLSA